MKSNEIVCSMVYQALPTFLIWYARYEYSFMVVFLLMVKEHFFFD